MENNLVLTNDVAMEYPRISKPAFPRYFHLAKIMAIKAGKRKGLENASGRIMQTSKGGGQPIKLLYQR
jgi:hypothetical protein